MNKLAQKIDIEYKKKHKTNSKTVVKANISADPNQKELDLQIGSYKYFLQLFPKDEKRELYYAETPNYYVSLYSESKEPPSEEKENFLKNYIEILKKHDKKL